MGVNNPYTPYHRRKRHLYLQNNKYINIYYLNINILQKKDDVDIFIGDGATGILKICQPIF